MGLMVGPGSMPTMSTPAYPPVPPHAMPPARTINVAGRGEFFLRDSGETDTDRPAVMLLHGWTVSADLNWHGAYDALIDAGYRVLAIDHRGHGRGLRALVPFRLTDCAADAAAVVREIGCGPEIFVGYSMGGTIAQLVARDHRDIVAGIVLSGTSQHFQDPETVKVWRLMGALKIGLSVSPRGLWRAGFRRAKIPSSPQTAWWLSELTRHSARDIAEAGRELGRFDSRPWLTSVNVPAASVITTRDRSVSPANQRALAAASRSAVFEVPIDHLEVTSRAADYNPALLDAVAAVRAVDAVPIG
jgi:3-oxoadipate enol-lactonase